MLLKMLCDLGNYKRKLKREQKLLKGRKGLLIFFRTLTLFSS